MPPKAHVSEEVIGKLRKQTAGREGSEIYWGAGAA